MPESKTNDFVWDGSQKNFAIFEDKVFERSIDGNGGKIARKSPQLPKKIVTYLRHFFFYRGAPCG
jgi:hypothetical protein